MNGKEVIKQLLPDSHRATADLAVNVLLQKPALLETMFAVSCSNEYPWDMRAANVIEKADEKKPTFAANLVSEILQHLPNFKNDGPKRQYLRMLIRYSMIIDEDLAGLLYDRALIISCNPAESTGIRHNAIQVLLKLTKRFPEIQQEVFETLQLRSNEESGPFGKWLREIISKMSLQQKK